MVVVIRLHPSKTRPVALSRNFIEELLMPDAFSSFLAEAVAGGDTVGDFVVSFLAQVPT